MLHLTEIGRQASGERYLCSRLQIAVYLICHKAIMRGTSGFAVLRYRLSFMRGIAVLSFYSAVCGIVIYQHPKVMKYYLRGALGFHGLRVWPILAIGFRDFPEKRAGFRVLDAARVTGIAIFFSSGFGYCN